MANSNLLALYGDVATEPTFNQGIDGTNPQGVGTPTPSFNYWRPTQPTYEGLLPGTSLPYSEGRRTYGPNASANFAPPSTATYDMGHYW